jgi:hypothetical protein
LDRDVNVLSARVKRLDVRQEEEEETAHDEEDMLATQAESSHSCYPPKATGKQAMHSSDSDDKWERVPSVQDTPTRAPAKGTALLFIDPCHCSDNPRQPEQRQPSKESRVHLVQFLRPHAKPSQRRAARVCVSCCLFSSLPALILVQQL